MEEPSVFRRPPTMASFAPNSPSSGCAFSSSTGATFGTLRFSSWLDALAVCLLRQWASGTVFGHPTLRSLIIQKIEAQNADVDGSPFFLDHWPGKVSLTDL